MSVDKLIARLEKLELLDEQAIADLRQQVAESMFAPSVEEIAQQLVEQGHVTAAQSKKLLADIAGSAAAPKPAAPPPKAPPKSTGVDNDLGLVMDEEEAPKATKPVAAASTPAAPPLKPLTPSNSAPKPSVAPKPKTGSSASGKSEKSAAKANPKPASSSPPNKNPSAKKEEPDDIILLEDASESAPGSPGITPLKGGGLAPLGDSGLTPIKGGGLAPLGAGSGLEPLDAAGGLMPLGGDGGLMPLDGADGLTSLDSFGVEGLMPMDGQAGGMGMNDFGAPSPMMGGGAPGGAMSGPVGQAGPPVKQLKRGGWDSPLMMLGGGALLLLLFAGLVLIYSLMRGTADELFTKAEDEYKAQTYDKAIIIYEKFLKDYATHNKASLVRVRRGLAKLRLVVDQSKDMRVALDTAKSVIPEIEVESRFADGRDELAAMLPKIAEDFAAKAKSAQTGAKADEYVALGDQAMELVNNPSYIPAALRESIQGRIENIRKSLDDAKRTILQDKALTQALGDIQSAVDAGDTAKAFDLRRQLLKEFPGLEGDAKLNQIVLKVSAREKDLVKLNSVSLAASADDVAASVPLLKLMLSNRKGSATAGTNDQVAFVLARGSVFGIDVASGKALWRRFVGHETLIHPQPLGKESGADALVVDAQRNELLRLNAKTGKIIWRLSIGEPFAAPAQPGTNIIVTTESGRLVEVDPETGNSSRSVQLPQPAYISASGDSRFPVFYQLGGHSNLYAIASDTLECKEVYYLGHKSGTIVVPPVIALGHLFVVENAGFNFANLHILKLNENGLGFKVAQEPIRLNGNVTTAMIQAKNRIAVLTNLTEARVFEVDSSREKEAVKEIAKQVATANSPEPGYVLADANVLWLAGNRLSALDIQASRGQMNSKWSKHESEPFIAPLQRFGNSLIHLRRRRGSLGVTVTSSRTDTGEVQWRTDLTVPSVFVAADAPRKQFVVINSHGDLYRAAADALRSGSVDKPTESAEVEGSEIAFNYADAAPLGDGRTVLSNQVDRRGLLLFDPERTKDSLRTSRLATGEHGVGNAPHPFEGGVIAPQENGIVGHYNADSGKVRSRPFQPRLEPGAKVEWQPATFIGAERKEFVITDSRRKMFRVGLREKPEAHLVALTEIEVPDAFVRPLACAGDTLYAISQSGSSNTIQSYALPGLTEGQKWELKGRVTAGPWQVGDFTIIVTEAEGILCMGAGQKQLWVQPAAHGTLAGPPMIDGKGLVFASQNGHIWRSAPESGQVIGHAELHESLTGTAAVFGTALLFTTTDGTIIAVREIPAS